MSRTFAQSKHAARALQLVESLQRRFVGGLERVSRRVGSPATLSAVEWLRDDGTHGGGERFEIGDTPVFDRGSVNVSQVHYDDLPDRRLSSATALSTIIHPRHPRAPSVHIHVSWTEMRDGSGYWRVMADLNPSIPNDQDRDAFADALRRVAPDHWDDATAQGDRYFYIPALERHRGVCHFYLESYRSDDADADEYLARRVGEAAIETYLEILEHTLKGIEPSTAEERDQQLAYHTLYLFQVLTLDRGTTSGLLIHSDNDLGIMGSLPSHVDRDLLASWSPEVPGPQGELVDALVDALPPGSPAPVTLEAKLALATAVRQHFQAHPEALELQASGGIVPPTVANHR
ncbi:MAG: coproporphyrinogen III oxidase [Myxococcales bacterium]|nr:coproporphyrinogen III oxidase [Myxococcales bacterium]MCB9715428.1 coproporphyrinogen III oxidase [Myxococcales bacterium]